MHIRALCLFLVAALASARGGREPDEEEGGPITKVVELIQEMKAKVEADGTLEQAIFDKYACWCEETTARKSAMIAHAMTEIKRTGTIILEQKGAFSIRDHEINVLTKQIKENQDAQRSATVLRQKQNGGYLAKKAEMEQTIGSLEKGIMVLSGAGTKKASLLERKGLMSMIAKDMHKAVRNLPTDSDLSPEQISTITKFLQQDPGEFYDQKAQKAASYNPASSTIMGILKDMYDTFVKNLESETSTESQNVLNFEELMAVKEKELASLNDELKVRTAEKAEAEAQLADASQELDDTTVQMKKDIEFFDDTKAACTTKADQWSERVRARTEELAGMDKAIEILTSDDAKELFGKAIKPGMEKMFLLQEGESTGASETRKMKAYDLLKKTAQKGHSVQLAMLAAKLRSTTSGHFDAVIEEIDKMLNVLHEEEKADITQRDWCKEETFKNEQEVARYEYKISKTEAHEVRLQTQLEELEATLAKTVEEISDTKTEIKDMEDERIAEHEAFQGAKADDEGAVKLLEKAIEALSSFYKNNPPAFVQKQEPEFGDEDTAPDATFTDKNKSAGESKGIVGIMTMLKEDLEAEIANGIKNEVSAHEAFEGALAKAHGVLKALEEKKTNLKESIVQTNKDIDDTQSDIEELNGLLKDEKDYLAEIKPDCDFIFEKFAERRQKRTEEMDGLVDAKAMLSGAEGELIQTSSFLTPRRHA